MNGPKNGPQEATSSIYSARRYHLVFIFFLSITILAVSSHFLWTGQLNTFGLGHTLNDQVGYVTASRNLAEKGKLESSLYYPALVRYYKTHNVLYMPGIFYIRALFFSVFGYSVFTAFLPNFLAYIGSGTMLFAIAEKIYNRKTAYVASLALLLFPPFLLYAFTAMMETFFVFAWLLFFYVFISMPSRKKHIFGPLLLMVPYLIRESAALAIPGLAAMIYLDGNKTPVRRAIFFAGTSASLVYVLKQISPISDLPPLFLARFMNITAVYADALALTDLHISPLVLFVTFLKNVFGNIAIFLNMLVSWSPRVDFQFFVAVIFLFVASLMMRSSSRPEAKAVRYFTFLTVIATLLVIFSMYMYFVEGYNGIRQMLYIFPLLVCVITDALLSSRLFEKKLATMALLILFFVVYIGFGVKMMRIFRSDLMHADEYAVECNKFLDSLGVANTNFFISPHTIGLDYVNSHYPIKWSFIPNNEATLKLLSEKYSIDVLIIPPGHPLTVDIKEIKVKDSLLDGAFRVTEIRTFENSKYLIYRPVRGQQEKKSNSEGP